ncbi:gamma-glutamylcyclotransferase [Kitasatospora sp. NBC_01250]|uniref:gamma-glutamylcyclotransferase family protein n=1 Tax=unclassified Kitasatospora TaxID=2633591 RepID=UPI002E0E2FEB|nr:MULTISPECIES: gamma-glutamylcyclotransferase family protein [unclassified Kitasatospora]WSJ66432.1 gamma-glutamylcyclotransferase [Kitasatospora sp. NBC_01302]
MTDRSLPFFVYGTLRPGQRNHAHFLGGHCARIQPAVLPGALLHEGPGYPYLVADPDPRRRVHGELVTVRPGEFAQVLAALDLLEECRPDGSGLYVRRPLPVTVTTADSSTDTGATGTPGPGPTEQVTAWVYLAGPDEAARLRANPAPIASGSWPDPR